MDDEASDPQHLLFNKLRESNINMLDRSSITPGGLQNSASLYDNIPQTYPQTNATTNYNQTHNLLGNTTSSFELSNHTLRAASEMQEAPH
jgi:hypothetical protein